MRVEGCDLIGLGQRQPHLVRKGGKVRGREIAVAILNKMQVLDQQIAAALAIAEQRADVRERLRIDLATLRGARRPAPAASVAAAAVSRNSRRRVCEAHYSLKIQKS